MGIKRPFVEEEYPEPSFARPKVVEYCIKSPTIGEQSYTTAQTFDSRGEIKSSVFKGQLDQEYEDGIVLSLPSEKKLNGSEPLFLMTDCDEAVENEGSTVWSALPRYVGLGTPRRSPEPYIDPYVMLFNFPPRKEVLIGQQYQAEVPLWDPNLSCCKTSSDIVQEHRLMGTSIIPLPGLIDSTVDGVRVGGGRTDCSCPDRGSMRCVQQHVKEAREKLLHSIGDEKFSQLGFLDMGEEVASNWTPDDERIFHDVVFSNPKSHGRNFWKHLRDVFPHKTMKELVSYYFNVFMLHRRAVQNRSFYLEIDSDDDDVEWESHHQYRSESCEVDSEIDDGDQAENGFHHFFGDGEEDAGNSGDEWFDDHGDFDGDSSWVDGFWSPNENSGVKQQQQTVFEVNDEMKVSEKDV